MSGSDGIIRPGASENACSVEPTGWQTSQTWPMGRRWLFALAIGVGTPLLGACTSESGLRRVQSGDELQSGEEVSYEFRTHCGARILGRFNGRWWRATEALELRPPRSAAWYPRGWEPSSADDSELLDVVLRYDGGRRRIEATHDDTEVTYEPGSELAEWEFCA